MSKTRLFVNVGFLAVAASAGCGADPGSPTELVANESPPGGEAVGSVAEALGASVIVGAITPNTLDPDDYSSWDPDRYVHGSPEVDLLHHTAEILNLQTGATTTFPYWSAGYTLGDTTHTDSSYLYYVEVSGTTGRSIHFRRVALSGAPDTVIADTASGVDGEFVVGGKYLYWSDALGVHKKPKDGSGTAALLVSGAEITLLGADGNTQPLPTLFFTKVTTDGKKVELRSVDTSGGSATLYRSVTAPPVQWGRRAPAFPDLSWDASYFYWDTDVLGQRTLWRMPRTAGAIASSLTVSSTVSIRFPVSNGTNVYWAEIGASTSSILRRSGGFVTTQKSGLPRLEGLSLGASALYWAERTANGNSLTVKKAALP